MAENPTSQEGELIPMYSGVIPTHLAPDDLLHDGVVFTPCMLRHRLHCFLDQLCPGDHIVVPHCRETHSPNSLEQGHRRQKCSVREERGTVNGRVQMSNGSASTSLKTGKQWRINEQERIYFISESAFEYLVSHKVENEQ